MCLTCWRLLLGRANARQPYLKFGRPGLIHCSVENLSPLCLAGSGGGVLPCECYGFWWFWRVSGHPSWGFRRLFLIQCQAKKRSSWRVSRGVVAFCLARVRPCLCPCPWLVSGSAERVPRLLFGPEGARPLQCGDVEVLCSCTVCLKIVSPLRLASVRVGRCLLSGECQSFWWVWKGQATSC